MPATIVGSANGRSMTPLSAFLPRNSSRTRTQAIVVPAKALMTQTTADEIRVSLSAATASGLEIAVQNVSQPPSVDLSTRAASGMSTITLR